MGHPVVSDKYLSTISSSMRSYVEVRAKQGGGLLPWQSKFGGLPYLPKGVDYPRNKEGNPLYLLAQLNFEEIPYLFPYPDKGILQFWIADDDLLGLEFEGDPLQENFKAIYYPTFSRENLVRDFSFLPAPNCTPFESGEGECALEFSSKEMPITYTDYRFEKLFPNVEDEFSDWYMDAYGGGGHRIGGYPYFTQVDPREDSEHAAKELLLLQIDTDYDSGIEWGDEGVANFFISPSDLNKRDFSRVFYNWDCS